MSEDAKQATLVWTDGGEKFEGRPIYFALTTDRSDPDDCGLCADGVCVQRVERCEAWEVDVVVHGETLEEGRTS
jgi:hypothetical protein